MNVEPQGIPLPPSQIPSPTSSLTSLGLRQLFSAHTELSFNSVNHPDQTEATEREETGGLPTPKVSLFRWVIVIIPKQNTQDSSKNERRKVQRVRIEPERTGWTKLYALVRQVDKDRMEDIRDEIDTLLVFVSFLSFANL